MKSYNLINAKVITLDPKNSIAESITIHNGKIEAVNSINSNYTNLDMAGSTIIPGFIDAHFHLKNYGKRLDMLNLKGVNSLDEIIGMIKSKLNSLAKGEWLIGYGWDQNLWEQQDFPEANILNSIAPENPIYLTRVDGHSAWVNQAAIHKTQVSIDEIANINGGSLINDCVVIDNSMDFFRKILPVDSKENIKSWIKIAIKEIVKKGITGVHDAWQDLDIVEAINELIEEGEFPIRCYGMLGSSDTNLIDTFFQQGHNNTPYYNIRSVKAFVDGALGSRGAALYEPYCDDKNNCGLILITQEEFLRVSELCHKYNFQLNTHAIGDKGNGFVLDCYGKILNGPNDRRWRVEHAQIISKEDQLRYKEMDLIASMQPSHAIGDLHFAPSRLGMDRVSDGYVWRNLIDLGVLIAGGSDAPVEIGDPRIEFYAAITRKDLDGFYDEGWHLEQAVTREEALKMFTIWPAYAAFQEDIKGTLEVGKLADLTIFSKDIMTIAPEEILNAEVVMTIVNGKIVFN